MSKIKWFHSLRFKLLLSYSFIGLCPIFIFSFLIINAIESYFKNDRTKSLLTDANIISSNISKSIKNIGHQRYIFSELSYLDTELEVKSSNGKYRILVFDKSCEVVSDSNKTDIGKTYLVPEVVEALTTKDQSSLRGPERRIYTAVSITDFDSNKIGAVLIVSSAEEIFFAIDQIQQKLFLIVIFSFFFIICFAFFISNFMTNPLKKTLAVVDKMATGEFNQRIILKNHDEFAQLALSFNKMTDKLNQIESAREEFVSNVSHELKTPLSSIKVLAESVLGEKNTPIEVCREFLEDINSEINRMTNIVNNLLTLVKLDKKKFPLSMSRLNLTNLLQEIIKRLLPLAKQKNISLDLECGKNIFFLGDEVKLSLAVSNLIDNSIKYTQSNGKVKITANADKDFVYIDIQDNGIGIRIDEQDKIFERFYRVDKTRDRETGGTGLGLSITRSVIEMHNGEIKLKSEEGVGTTFLIKLPIRSV